MRNAGAPVETARPRPSARDSVGLLLNRSFRYWSLLPAVLLFAALTLYPLLNLLRMSVSTIVFANGAEVWTFTPLRNLEALAADDVLHPAVINTIVFVAVSVAIEMLLGVAHAIAEILLPLPRQ